MRQYGTMGSMGSMGRDAVSSERPRSLPRTAMLAAAVVLGCSLATIVAVAGVWGGSGGGGEVELISWEAGRGSDPALEDGLQEMNETKHILKDPRAGTKNGWSNNFLGMKTPIKNWNPLGEDMVRSGIDDVFISRRDPAANETRPATQEVIFPLVSSSVSSSMCLTFPLSTPRAPILSSTSDKRQTAPRCSRRSARHWGTRTCVIRPTGATMTF
jgi:hypothetical protein